MRRSRSIEEGSGVNVEIEGVGDTGYGNGGNENPNPNANNTSNTHVNSQSKGIPRNEKLSVIPIRGDRLRDFRKGRREMLGVAEKPQQGNVRCGIGAVDGYLLGAGDGVDGGFERGSVVGISGDLGGEGGGGIGRLITMHLIASVILEDHGPQLESTFKPRARAAIIDTTGSFPLSLLASIIRTRLIYYSTRKNSTTSRNNIGIEELVRNSLERVSYLRALDFVGVVEAVAEVKKGCEDVEKRNEETRANRARERALKVAERAKETRNREVRKGDGGKIQKLEIGDSDDDDDDSDSYSDNLETKTALNDTDGVYDSTDIELEEEEGTVEMLVLDNFSNMAGALFGETERDSAHSLLSTLTQTIHSLTKSHNLLTIILNSTTSTNPTNAFTTSSTKAPPNLDLPHLTKNSNNNSKAPKSSIFESVATRLRPAFAKTFEGVSELHLFCSKVPRRRADAERIYGGGGGDEGEDDAVGWCDVVEVLRDDLFGGRRRDEDDVEQGECLDSNRKRKRREQRWVGLVVGRDGSVTDFGG